MSRTRYARLLCSAAVIALAGGGAALADDASFNIQPQSLNTALNAFSEQSAHPVLFKSEMAVEKLSPGISGQADPEVALAQLLQGTGLSYRRTGDTFVIVQGGSADPQSASAAGDGADGTVEALIVTAQKREEDIQDVPIAISAFSQEDLTTRQVAGGPDLITQIPNFSFTKTNFTSYSIQIRGIGTQAISATTDPAVAVAFNNTPFVRNRFFEQEFYDLERLEVLRGPQGTLYGRNATAGVVNIISAKPKFSYDAKASADIGNYSSTRIEGMINIPLVEDVVALRLAGAWTKRDGYALNQMTGSPIDGRDLWSTRVSLRFEPTDWISANFIYEHFEEDDDRLRSGKQLCKKHLTPTEINGVAVRSGGSAFDAAAYLTQGCLPVSLYSPEAFQTPNGFSLPYYGPTSNLGNPVFASVDPYLNSTQSRDLRVIESSVEPDYRAKSDIAELQVAIDIGDQLTLNSETSYSTDELWSLQDFNRFTTVPNAFNPNAGSRPGLLDENGVFCDPQLGCSDRLLLVDLSTSESSQFSQEFRLGSDFDGPFNFSLGANFLRHDAYDKYYVFINSITMFAAAPSFLAEPGAGPYEAGVTDNTFCLGASDGQILGQAPGGVGAVGATAPYFDPEMIYGALGCKYIDPNPIGSLNDEGRNYFLSKNPYKLISYAAFGEIYYNVTPGLKITSGLRFTVDKKSAPQIPSWLIASWTSGPYPVTQIVEQEWREPTGRLAIDWKPTLGFTDETLVYASYAHGYKAGGANPPPPVLVTYTSFTPQEILPDTFGPEFVNAFEVGTKNTVLDGALTLNLTAFYYDYFGYQTSEIRNRSAVNSNFDAEVWGLELEADWRVTEALRVGLKGGYNGTRMADGSKAVDLMDRTAGNEDWYVLRPFPTIPSSCIIPVEVLTAGGFIQNRPASGETGGGLCGAAYFLGFDPVTMLPYVPDPEVRRSGSPPSTNTEPLPANLADYEGFDPSTAPNDGRGFDKDLSGNELPNAPNYTATVTVDYTMPLPNEWLLTLHGDYHYQGESWARVFNSDPYDRINAFSTVNLSAIFANENAGWKVMAYVKNAFDETAITGAFLNSDDTGLTTNVFLTEPRLYGLRVTKDWTGLGGVFGWSAQQRPAGEPYPLTLEIGGGVDRFSRDVEAYAPDWLERYSAEFPLPSPEDEDLDWGDTRSIKLTYAPASSPWRISGAYRFGKTKGEDSGSGYEAVPGGTIVEIDALGKYSNRYFPSKDNHWRGGAEASEEYTIIDFMVGREFGIGEWAITSTLGAGIRYAELASTSDVVMDGVPDRYVQPFVDLRVDPAESHHSRFTTGISSERTFDGVGPSVSWEAALRLFGDDETGHADLDWTVQGGVLFGKQAVDSREDRFGRYYFGANRGQFQLPFSHTFYDDTVLRTRRQDVTVPNLSANLGLSYAIDRVKVSTGYSYDRFFDAIDGGYKEARDFDRTIHGPYVKLSVGFGG